MSDHSGYAGKILKVNLSDSGLSELQTQDYADLYVGGRGIGTRLYWEEVLPETGPLDPENRLIFVTGPATGIAPAGSKWQIFGKSPVTGLFCYSNLGGKGWAVQLKRAGFDGLVVHGKSEKPVYIFIHDGTAEIRDAAALWGKGPVQVNEILKQELGAKVRVVATGPAGDNQVALASVLADGDASGSSGFGAVMGSKNLKAIAVKGSGRIVPADKERLGNITQYVRRLVGNRPQTTMVHLPPDHWHEVCPGCIGCSSRSFYKTENSRPGKYTCQSGMMYQDFAEAYHGGKTDVSFLASRLCDDYGLDTWGMMATVILLAVCHGMGVLTDEDTGLPLTKIGSLEFFDALAKKIAFRDGIGDVFAQGPKSAAEKLGDAARGVADSLLTDPFGHVPVFDPRLFMSTGLIYAMEPRMHIPQLAEIGGTVEIFWGQWANGVPGAHVSSDVMRAIAARFWGSELAVDFSTYDGKALAAKTVQDRWFGNECVILCLWMFPIWQSEHTEDHLGDPTIESQILSAVTGSDFQEESLYRIGERILNLQRAVLAREGRAGRESDKLPEFFFTQPLETEGYDPECIVPGKDGEVISRKGAVLDRTEFEKMKEEYYGLRGWDVATGLQTTTKLRELELQDVAVDLESRNLAV